jgi:hypothetical protein
METGILHLLRRGIFSFSQILKRAATACKVGRVELDCHYPGQRCPAAIEDNRGYGLLPDPKPAPSEGPGFGLLKLLNLENATCGVYDFLEPRLPSCFILA